MTLVKTDTKKGKKVGFLNSYILRRIERNKNFVCCITGQTGSGKSYAALKEGEILDPNFDIRNVCFTPEEFMDLVNGKSKELKRGAVIVYDEVQVTMGALDYQSLQAKLINNCLQTFRYMGFILFMTSPYFHFINKSARMLFHSRWETNGIDYTEKRCKLKPFLLQTNQKSGETYEKYLRAWTKKTGLVPVNTTKVGMASAKLVKEYEAKRKAWSEQNNRETTEMLEEKKNGKKKAPLTDMQVKVIHGLLNKKTVYQLAKELDVSNQTIYFHMKQAEKKKIQIKPKYKDNEVIYYEVYGFEGI